MKPSQRKRLNLGRLKDLEVHRTKFSIKLQYRSQTGVDIDKLWLGIKNTYMEAGTKTLAYVKEKRKKWTRCGNLYSRRKKMH